MFGYSYKFKMHPTKQVITLSPTMGTYAKVLAPGLVLTAGLWGMYLMMDALMDEPEIQNTETPEQ